MNYLLKSTTYRTSLRVLCVYILSVVALIFYLYGFFPLDYSSNLKLQKPDVEIRNFGKRQIDKLAFIVIDALRYDFVVPKGGEKLMPFTHSAILNNQACLVTTVAHSPTVTMPRLKAISSGSISTYIDVVLNFMTTDFKEDNFINIAASNKLKIVFYGDDTWLKLYPNAFLRSEGTSSFFALDYAEVDNNVTRHIKDELKKSDWDIIILHYLGLDHIGHTEGPNSPLIKPKLLEMDMVVKVFSDHFKKLEEEGLRTMVIVTGDHGMKDSGSHGGVTYPEITVPLVAFSNPCVVLPGWPKDHTPFQIDIAPTLSVLFGQRFPANSMGKIIPCLLQGINTHEILQYLELNRLQLKKLKNLDSEDPEMNSLEKELNSWLLSGNHHKEDSKQITEKYFQFLNQYSQEIVKSNSDFKMFYLIFGIFFLWIFLIVLLLQMLKEFSKPKKITHWLFAVGTTLHAVSLFSSSFIEEEHQTWYFFWVTFCILSILESLNQKRVSNLQKIKLLTPWLALALAHRFLRKLNQTGDKWASLPDIKFYLYSEGQVWLLILFLLGIGLLFWCAFSEKCSVYQLLSYGISLSAIVGFRIATAYYIIALFFIRGTSEVFIFWTSFTIFGAQTMYYRTSIHLVWLLLVSLVLRPHNVILLPLEVFTSKEIHKLFYNPDNVVWNNIGHVWLGNLFFFYQGNGNSLSNIDVASGFTGTQSYDPFYAGFMMIAHTFNGHILSFILSPKMNLVCTLTRIIPLTLYCTALLFQLNHLFIWSVFSPKLLYETTTTFILTLLMVFSNLFYFYKKKNYHF